jgi:glycerol kinase
MTDYILSIDQGTTSTRALLFSPMGEVAAIAQREFKQYFPRDGWVEHDPEQIWQDTLSVCRDVMTRVPDANVVAIGITNQRETSVVWDRRTGQPIYNAIVWQDRRTADQCQQLKQAGLEPEIVARTGLLIDPYFSASKIAWILDQVPGARELAEAQHLAFGTIDSFLLWRLTGGRVHATDATNASRTSLFNIHTQTWDDDLLSWFRVPKSLLPEVRDSADDFGVSDAGLLGQAIPICSLIGDQQAALVGQACFSPGMVKSTYGTGCFMVMNTGDVAAVSKNRLLTTVAYRLSGQPCYAIEGSIFVAGAAIQWLRDGLRLIQDASESARFAEQVGYHNSVYLVPAFTGLGAPYWDPQARGGLFGLTRDTGIAELITAGLQSVCYQTKDLLSAMELDGARVNSIRVDGGMVVNDWFVQFLSDILQVCVERPRFVETTALGAAYLAGLQAGIYQGVDEITKCWQLQHRFDPVIESSLVSKLYGGWLDSVARVRR